MPVKTLDAELSKLGYEIVEGIKRSDKKTRKNLINHIDKALGVLMNDGVYAYYVFCLSKSKQNNEYKKLFIEMPVNCLKDFLNIDYDEMSSDSSNYCEVFFQNISNSIDELLFFKNTLEKALTYTRYHAKAIDE